LKSLKNTRFVIANEVKQSPPTLSLPLEGGGLGGGEIAASLCSSQRLEM
jgi:hypothetical protein